MAKKLLSAELEKTSLIHLHTDVGSPGDGAGKIEDYMKVFQDRGVQYATLTDHGDIGGTLAFYRAAKKAGIVPGIGCEFYLNDNRDVVPVKKEENTEELTAHMMLYKNTGASLTADEQMIADTNPEIMDTIMSPKATEKQVQKAIAKLATKARRQLVLDKKAEQDDEENPDDLRNNHLICVAKTEKGIKSIIKINNEAVIYGFKGKPRTTTEKVFALAEDLIVSSACLAGFPARAIRKDMNFDASGNVTGYTAGEGTMEAKRRIGKWQDRFGEDFYLELQINELQEQHVLNDVLLSIGKEMKINCVIAQDCHYTEEGDDFLQLIKMLNRTRRTLRDMENGPPPGMWVFHARELFVKDNDSLVAAAKRLNYKIPQNVLTDCLINNHQWFHKTKVHWNLSQKHYNQFKPPAGFETSADYFTHLVKEGYKTFAKKGYIPAPGHTLQEYVDRINKTELHMLIEKDFVDYLLETRQSMTDVVNALDGSRLHLGPGRGSVGACLCAFLIGITKIDPIRHGLLFFRFLSEARSNEIMDIEMV